MLAGVRPGISVQDVFCGAAPFFIADALTVASSIALPAILLYLPGQLGVGATLRRLGTQPACPA
ncbi:MAG: hypothetical protein GDA41_02025 [Rhodospirillales bacterium]|nr:hypothetical protein [Rhodospirillales bacterium]